MKKVWLYGIIWITGLGLGFVGGMEYVRQVASPQPNTTQTPAQEVAEEQQNPDPTDKPVVQKTTLSEQEILQKAEREVAQQMKRIEQAIPSDTLPKDTLIKEPSKQGVLTQDLGAELPNMPEPDPDPEIVIKREELIATFSVKRVLTGSEQDTTQLDSAAQQALSELSDIQQQTAAEYIQVEYWESPVNFKGYQMGNHKLVIYGLEPDSACTVLELPPDTYLKHRGNFYIIERTFDFKPLAPEARLFKLEQLNGL